MTTHYDYERTASKPKRKRLRVWGNERLKLWLLGQRMNDGIIFKCLTYVMLISISVLYLSPLFYMLSTSFKDISDLIDPAVRWIPRQLKFENYADAFKGLYYLKSLSHTLFMASAAALLQMLSCAITGYTFARMNFPLKNALFFIVLITFIIPTQTMAIPLFVMFSKLGWLNSPLPFIVPAVFAQGIKGALFIIIFRQFFATLPKEMEESARMDGAGAFRTYWKIMLPLAKPALLIVFLFSFVWHWNTYFEAALYLKNEKFLAMALQMDWMQGRLNDMSLSNNGLLAGQFDMNEPIKMAGALLIILPPLILYMFTQRHFVEGIERTGLVE
ncbi:carbohydrate ABC transporter permease [Paenibacillus thermotolerans]|uniref:carbohydrate ABC transporter permease n=1 Tax=Paenibacillus thermotolerans TaxID=3027807 RepID=UPI002367AD52|nr:MULTISPECIES: carbohydrate ABC transporter permease [unclassified Paenibacillus]